MADYPKIWFLRHGQTEWNRVFRLQGHLDSALTAQGVEDARSQSALLLPVLMQKPEIFVSPLGRALHTARIALHGAPFQTDPRLKEIHAGDWQGRLRTEIIDENPQWATAPPTALEIYEAAPKGEGITAFHARIVDFLDSLTDPAVIIAHGLLGQVLRAHVCGIPLCDAGHLSNRQGVIYELERGAERVLSA